MPLWMCDPQESEMQKGVGRSNPQACTRRVASDRGAQRKGGEGPIHRTCPTEPLPGPDLVRTNLPTRLDSVSTMTFVALPPSPLPRSPPIDQEWESSHLSADDIVLDTESHADDRLKADPSGWDVGNNTIHARLTGYLFSNSSIGAQSSLRITRKPDHIVLSEGGYFRGRFWSWQW